MLLIPTAICRNNFLRHHMHKNLPVKNKTQFCSDSLSLREAKYDCYPTAILRLSSLQNHEICISTCGKEFLNSTSFSIIVINCTSLTQMVDPLGPLRMSSCDNHYGAQCNFSCAIGYRLNGSSTVTCVAPGNQHPGAWNNTIPTCEGKKEKRKKDERPGINML